MRPFFLLTSTLVLLLSSLSAHSAESTVGKWRVIEVPPDPVYPKKAGRFVSEVGKLEITTPECFALWPEGEEEGQDPAKSDHLTAERASDCKNSNAVLRYIFLDTHANSTKKRGNCEYVVGSGGYFAAATTQIAGHQSCLSVRIKGGWPEKPGDVWWEFQGSCPTTTYEVTFLRHESQSSIEEMKKTHKPKVPSDIQAVIDSIHCLPTKK